MRALHVRQSPKRRESIARSAGRQDALYRRQGLKVFDGLSGGIEPATPVSVADLGLPVDGTSGVLLVFWKST